MSRAPDPPDSRPRPPKLNRAPKLHKHPRSGFYYSVFYDPARRPARKWYALHTDKQRLAMKRFAAVEAAWEADTLDPWRPQAGAALVAGHVSFADAVARYVAERERKGEWRAKTSGGVRRLFEAFADTLAPALSPAHVTAADVERFVNSPPSAKAKGNVHDKARREPNTVRGYVSSFRAFFDWCVAEGYADHNPAAAVPLPRIPKKSIKHLEPAEFDHLLKTIRTEHAVQSAAGTLWAPRLVVWLADVVELAVYTGLRRGELIRLRWRDVALKAEAGPTLYVRNTARGKTKSGNERPVPLVPPAVELLRRLEAARTNEDPDAPVLLSPDDRRGEKPISGDTLSRTFKSAVRLAGLDEALSPHSLRKTCGTWLLNRGVEMAVVQRILGHAKLATTEGSYAQVWDRTVREQLDRAFGGGASASPGRRPTHGLQNPSDDVGRGATALPERA
jgi:integrase